MTAEQSDRPGSEGEKELQERFDTVERADDFYEGSMRESLNERMRAFLRDRRTVFVGCTSPRGTTRVRVRSGESVVDVHGSDRVSWAEPADSALAHRAADAAHATLLAVDWEDTTVGFHLNGEVSVEPDDGNPRCVVDVEEAYIHCAKHVPRLERDAGRGDAGTGHRDGGRRSGSRNGTVRIEDGSDDVPIDSLDVDFGVLYESCVADRIFFVLGTADADGETDISPRFGPPGFVQRTDRGLAYPEYRGNGVHASLGNMLETGQACFTFVDLWATGRAVHVEGEVALRDDAPAGARDVANTDRTKVWVEMNPDDTLLADADVPRYSLVEHDPPWGTDDDDRKRAGFFTGRDADE